MKQYKQQLLGGQFVTIYDLLMQLSVESGCPYLENNLIGKNPNFSAFGTCGDLFDSFNLQKGYNIVSSTLLAQTTEI